MRARLSNHYPSKLYRLLDDPVFAFCLFMGARVYELSVGVKLWWIFYVCMYICMYVCMYAEVCREADRDVSDVRNRC